MKLQLCITMTPSFDYMGSGTQTQVLGQALTDQGHFPGPLATPYLLRMKYHGDYSCSWGYL